MCVNPINSQSLDLKKIIWSVTSTVANHLTLFTNAKPINYLQAINNDFNQHNAKKVFEQKQISPFLALV